MADGFFPARGASPELLALVRESAIESGRDPAAVEITASMPDDPDLLPAMAKAGIGRVLIPVTGMGGLKRAASGLEGVMAWRQTIEQYAEL